MNRGAGAHRQTPGRRLGSARDERGAVIVVVALSMTVLMAATALSFDIGREVDQNRTVQAVADSAALDAANFLTGASNSPTLDSTLTTQAVASASRNGFTTSSTQTVTATPGTWTVAGGFTAVSPGDSSTVPDAVQVTVAAPTSFDFLPGTATSTRSATAVRQLPNTPPVCPGCQGSGPLTPDAALTVGSFLVNVDSSQSALLNGLLGGALGTTLNLSAVSYQGLAAADINMNDILSANAGVGTLNNLLNTSVSPKTALGYVANGLGADAATLLADGQPAAAAILQGAESTLNTIIPGITVSTPVTLCKLIYLANTSSCTASPNTPAGTADVSVLGLLTGVAQIANGSHAINLSVAGLGLVTVSAWAISPVAVAGPGPVNPPPACSPPASPCHPTSATDQQVQVTISVNTGLVAIDLAVTAATATGTLDAISCGAVPSLTTDTIGVTSTAATINPSVSVVLGLVKLSVPVTVNVGEGAQSQSLTFTGPFTAQTPPPQTVGVADPGVSISAGSGVLGAVLSLLNPVLALLNPVVGPLLSDLGVSVGGATVTSNTVTCGTPVLVG